MAVTRLRRHSYSAKQQGPYPRNVGEEYLMRALTDKEEI